MTAAATNWTANAFPLFCVFSREAVPPPMANWPEKSERGPPMILAPNWSLLQMNHNSSCNKVRRIVEVINRESSQCGAFIISDLNHFFLLITVDVDNTGAAAGQSNSASASQVQQNNANASSSGTMNN